MEFLNRLCREGLRGSRRESAVEFALDRTAEAGCPHAMLIGEAGYRSPDVLLSLDVQLFQCGADLLILVALAVPENHRRSALPLAAFFDKKP